MTITSDTLPPSFGFVDFAAEHGVLHVDPSLSGFCRLTLLARTERGYPRRELAVIPGEVWGQIATVVQNELLRGMDPVERGPNTPSFRSGDNAVSPLIARELAVLLWSVMEDDAGTHIDALMAGWRQLAREERWWLYARASNPSQRLGHGWRRALYFALTDPADTRAAPRLLDIIEAASDQKKKRSGANPTGSNQGKLKKTQREKVTPAKKSPSKQKAKARRVDPPRHARKKVGSPRTLRTSN